MATKTQNETRQEVLDTINTANLDAMKMNAFVTKYTAASEAGKRKT